MAKRGRPKKPETIEREKSEASLKSILAKVPKMTDQERMVVERMLSESKNIEDQIYKRHSPTIPHDLMLAVESLGDRELFEEDEWLIEREQKVAEKYNALIAAEQRGRVDGGQTTSDNAKARATRTWGKNQELIDKIGRNHSIHSASQTIWDQWETLGDGGKKPTIRTIQNWYHIFCR
jgi:hypothetical protein